MLSCGSFSAENSVLTKMAKTIFFRVPNISKLQVLLLVFFVVFFVGCLLLERSYAGAHVSSDVKINGKAAMDLGRESQDNRPRLNLTLGEKDFLLQGKPLRILSGAIHYFRVVPEYWKDRLLKLKAMGLNTVET